jgi:hypothetical protein
MLSAAEVDRFKRKGFLLLKGVFSAGEVAQFKAIGDHAPGIVDLSSLAGLQSLWTDPRLVETAKQLLAGPIAFFGEASYRRINSESDHPTFERVLHHDAKGTLEHLFNRQHAPTPEPYPIIRFGIYLQDHASQSGGLKVVPGSHQIDSSAFALSDLQYYNVPSEPGDMIVFCNKILHAAYALRLKQHPDIALSPAEESAADPDKFLPFPKDRRTIFIDYAGSNELADIYIKNRALHLASARNGFVNSFVHGSFLEDAQRVGVRLRLDAAVVEAATKIVQTAVNGAVNGEGVAMLEILPTLCRLSRPWSSHYNFVPDVQGNDTAAAFEILGKLLPRIDELRGLVRTSRKDAHMSAKVQAVRTTALQ